MVTPAPVELGTATVTAAGVVTWRGSTYATDTGGHTVGDVVTVLRAGGRVAILPTPSGPGSFLPLSGGTLTGDLTIDGPARVYLDPAGDPQGWGELRPREIATAGGLMVVAFPPGATPEDGSGVIGLVCQATAPGVGETQTWAPFVMLQGLTGYKGPGGAETFRVTRDGDVTVGGRVTAAAQGIPYAMAAGRQAMTLTNAASVAVVVPFPTGRFTAGLFPILTVSPAGGTTPVDLFVSNVSNTGFTLTMSSRTGPITLTQNVAWHAVQMTKTTAEG